jgi:alkaline phosphatase
MIRVFVILLLFSYSGCLAQQSYPSAGNAHSHNDYEQASPFWAAWKQGFGSIEADIFLDSNQLVVAHDRKQISRRRTLDSLYLVPLQQCIAANKGFVYADKDSQLQLMIDIKSDAASTLVKLVEKLKSFPTLINSNSLQIVISGNRPPPSSFKDWPEWIKFDGEFSKEYKASELERVVMFSDNFARYSSWKGEGEFPEKERQLIQEQINKAHQLKRTVRFWNAPDNLNSWKAFVELGVDYINTDRIEELGTFLKEFH